MAFRTACRVERSTCSCSGERVAHSSHSAQLSLSPLSLMKVHLRLMSRPRRALAAALTVRRRAQLFLAERAMLGLVESQERVNRVDGRGVTAADHDLGAAR